jgi:hypothetical protein
VSHAGGLAVQSTAIARIGLVLVWRVPLAVSVWRVLVCTVPVTEHLPRRTLPFFTVDGRGRT